MKKPKVLFPSVEAGLGHIMPMRAIADEFEKLYGDKVDVVRMRFYADSEDKSLHTFEETMARETKTYTKSSVKGFFATFSMNFWGPRLDSFGIMKLLNPKSYKAGVARMKEIDADLVVSTHWATNYYAMHVKPDRPLTAMYCPDVRINPLFQYPCDLCMGAMEPGIRLALKRHPLRFNENNLKCVSFPIRNYAFDIPEDKRENRRFLGFDENKFTVVLAEGGYGIGKMEAICTELIARDLPITLVPVCGKNEELYEKFKAMKTGEKIDFRLQGLLGDEIFRLFGAADVMLGKTGASAAAEPCFFGLPMIITSYTHDIEKFIGEYYINVVGNAIKIFNPVDAADKVEEFFRNPELLQPYIAAAKAVHNRYGARKACEEIYKLLLTRFPGLNE